METNRKCEEARELTFAEFLIKMGLEEGTVKMEQAEKRKDLLEGFIMRIQQLVRILHENAT
jgi:hypothetical protein